jgi:hypothetical protein
MRNAGNALPPRVSPDGRRLCANARSSAIYPYAMRRSSPCARVRVFSPKAFTGAALQPSLFNISVSDECHSRARISRANAHVHLRRAQASTREHARMQAFCSIHQPAYSPCARARTGVLGAAAGAGGGAGEGRVWLYHGAERAPKGAACQRAACTDGPAHYLFFIVGKNFRKSDFTKCSISPLILRIGR